MILEPTEIERAVGGGLHARGRAEPARRVSIDSRRAEQGDLFVAIVGPKHDGHDHIAEAFARGAVGVICQRPPCTEPARGYWILVKDSVHALAALASACRDRFPGTVVAVTGSAGKTTTKNLIAAALGGEAGRTVASPASYNNHIGVPMTLVALSETTRRAVLEIGSNAPGEIAPLARLARPDIAVVTSIGESHLEQLGDVRGVVREKGSLLEALPVDGVAVINRDCEWFEELRSRFGGAMRSFGFSAAALHRIIDVEEREEGMVVTVTDDDGRAVPLSTCLTGRHNAANVAAAFAAARAAGVRAGSIRSRIAACTPAPMRMERRRLGSLTLINDAYNANPLSTRAAIESLVSGCFATSARVVVLGDMLELGEHSQRCHEEVLRFALRTSVDRILVVGSCFGTAARAVCENTGGSRVVCFADIEALRAGIRRFVGPNDAVLLKGSRGVALERCIAVLEAIGGARVETAA